MKNKIDNILYMVSTNQMPIAKARKEIARLLIAPVVAKVDIIQASGIYDVPAIELEEMLPEVESTCKHDWTYIGYPGNGHKECRKCGTKGKFN